MQNITYIVTDQTGNAWQKPVVARQAQRTHPGEDTPLQRSNGRVCCVRGAICNGGVPFRLHRGGVVNAQRVFVPRDLGL